jgi:hypothetical protein
MSLNSKHACSFCTQLGQQTLALDRDTDYQVRVNFNITMTGPPRCEWAVVDTVSVLGTDRNVTARVTKWQVDGEGIRRPLSGS